MAPVNEHVPPASDGLSPSDDISVGSGKPYAAPRLERYGDVRAITNSVGNMGNADNGTSPMHKTRT